MNGWINLNERVPEHAVGGMLLVTNNIAARDAFGHYSHVWLTSLVQRKESGVFVAFAEPSDQLIENLTHWRPALPEEWSGWEGIL